MTTKDPISAFWTFWAGVKDRIAKSFGEGGVPDELVQEINRHVSAIHEGLDWEFGPGREAQHHLCLSGHGDPELRVVAERWLHRAPEADETWEFHAARQGHPTAGLKLEIAGQEVELDALVASIERDDTREVLDIEVFHPLFATIEDPNLRGRIAFIGLDTLVGEDSVERWIGSVEIAPEEPEGAVPFAELAEEVERLADEATGDQWVVGKGERDGRPIFVTFNAALKEHALFDTHVWVTIPIAKPNDEGLTEKDEADVLNDMEDALVEALDDDGILLGRETWNGRRTIHVHVMEGGPAGGVIEAWKKRYPNYAIDVGVERDPTWSKLDDWR